MNLHPPVWHAELSRPRFVLSAVTDERNYFLLCAHIIGTLGTLLYAWKPGMANQCTRKHGQTPRTTTCCAVLWDDHILVCSAHSVQASKQVSSICIYHTSVFGLDALNFPKMLLPTILYNLTAASEIVLSCRTFSLLCRFRCRLACDGIHPVTWWKWSVKSSWCPSNVFSCLQVLLQNPVLCVLPGIRDSGSGNSGE